MTKAKMERLDNGYYRVVVGDRVLIEEEGYQVAANVEYAFNHGAPGTSECDEVARQALDNGWAR